MTRHRVARLSDVPETGSLIVRLNHLEIGIYRVAGELRAYRNICPHMGAPVCRGTVSGTTLPSDVYQYEYGRVGEILQCPWHGWEFDLVTGKHLVQHSHARLRSYPVEVHGDDIYLTTRVVLPSDWAKRDSPC